MADHNDRVELNTDRARAGATPHVTRVVLIAGLVLIIAIFAYLFSM